MAPVATLDSAVLIAVIDSGDTILAYHEATGATSVYTVTATFAHRDLVLVALSLDAETLTTTPEHPFFTLEWGWVNAADLCNGDAVRQMDGAYGVVNHVALVAHSQVMDTPNMTHRPARQRQLPERVRKAVVVSIILISSDESGR